MKIRIIIVPPENVNEDKIVQDAPQAPCLERQDSPVNEIITLRHLIQTCQPLASLMDSWNELDILCSTAWLCADKGTGSNEWMWNGKDGIYDSGDYKYHDFEITFEEVGDIPEDGMCQLHSVVSKNADLEDALIPPERHLSFFKDGEIVAGETKVSYKIFGRVPNEWEGEDDANPQNNIYSSIIAVSWFGGCIQDLPQADIEKPYREENKLFIQKLMEDQKN